LIPFSKPITWTVPEPFAPGPTYKVKQTPINTKTHAIPEKKKNAYTDVSLFLVIRCWVIDILKPINKSSIFESKNVAIAIMKPVIPAAIQRYRFSPFLISKT